MRRIASELLRVARLLVALTDDQKERMLVKMQWEKRGGHPNARIRLTLKKLEELGFKPIKNNNNMSPDGYRSNNTTTYEDADGRRFQLYEYIGVTQSENSYSAQYLKKGESGEHESQIHVKPVKEKPYVALADVKKFVSGLDLGGMKLIKDYDDELDGVLHYWYDKKTKHPLSANTSDFNMWLRGIRGTIKMKGESGGKWKKFTKKFSFKPSNYKSEITSAIKEATKVAESWEAKPYG